MASPTDSRAKQPRFQQPHFEWARQGRINAIAMYLDTGGDIDAKNHEGQSMLWLAVCNGHHSLVYWLLSKGAEANSIDLFGNSPLMIAACRGDARSVAMLIGSGADPLLQNADSMTAFDFARKNNDARVLKALTDDPHSPESKIEKIVRRLARKLILINKGRMPEGSCLQ